MSEKSVVSVPGIIGQMYEDRKTKKRGVLESREEKYKTLMLRADDGKSFNITYATFKSNWRKYQGEEVIQTSTQVEEQRKEEEKKEEKAKQIVETESVEVASKMTTKDKIIKIRAIDDVICSKIKNAEYSLKSFRNGKGGIIIRFASKKTKLVDIWYKFNYDRYEFVFGDNIYTAFTKELNKLVEDTKSEYVYKETWSMKHQYKVSIDSFDTFVDAILGFADSIVKSSEANTTKKEEK